MLSTGPTAHRGSRCISLLFLEHGTRRGRAVSVTPWSRFTPGRDPVPSVQEAGWAPEPVWKGAKNLAPTGIRSRTIQPVASRYTDYATRPTQYRKRCLYNDAVNISVLYFITQHIYVSSMIVNKCTSFFLRHSINGLDFRVYIDCDFRGAVAWLSYKIWIVCVSDG